MKTRTLALAICLFAAACVETQTPQPETTPLGLDLSVVDKHEISGTFATPATTISFHAAEVQNNVITVQFRLGDRSLDFELDFDDGFATFNAQLAKFNEADIATLGLLAAELETAFPGDHTTRTAAAQSLVQQAAFMAIAPANVSLRSIERLVTKSITCLASCSCSNQYIGNGYWRQAGKSSSCTGGSGNGCKGRCGVGCGSNGSGYYTHDCARHDYGLASWTAAFDDYSWGWNCSC